ncbi:response regulator [Desulfobacterales bacterium HSG17]|nr:response regulator [Desulfobacterales bacterium HSG17]
MNQNTAEDKFIKLRKQAEKLLALKGNIPDLNYSEDPLKLIHELQTYQVELELQNETLLRSQQELMQIQISYTELYDFAPVGYITTSLKGLIIRSNLTFADMLLVERANLMNQPLSAFIHIEDQDIYYKHLNNLSKSKAQQISELRLQLKDGVPLNVQLESTVVTNEIGDSEKYRTIVIDISKRKRIEKKLEEEMKLRTTLIEALPYPTMLIKKDRTIIFANKVAREVGAKVGGTCWQDFGHSDYIPEKDKEYINQHKTHEGLCSHCTFCLADEALNDLKPAIAPEVNAFGRIWETYWIPVSEDTYLHYALDITERNEMEGQLRQSSKMESIGTLTGGVAHDFNNLLYMIVGNTELALEDIPEWNPVHSNLEEIKSASLRAAGIVKQLLNFSRKTAQDLKPIGAVTIIKDALKFLRSTLPSTVKFKLSLPDADIPIQGDPIQINQVMMNLCTNASQAMQDTGGTLKIDVVTAFLNKEAAENYINLSAGNHIKITVSDSGPGIEPDVIDKIFDPYFTTKEFGAGSGMGLAVVHGIVKNHNGAIFVDSTPEEGATFNIFFPIIDELPEPEIEIQEDIPQGTESILFVDDEEPIANMMGRTLERLGYQIEVRLNPVEVLELFKAKPDSFDLVITDMTMPQMTGAKLAEKLKEIRADIPVIICTGHSAIINEEKANQLGIDGFVMKPVSKSKIARAIRDVLDK